MVAADAQTPREKIFFPFFSCTIQCWQAALTLRVKAASPGGSSIQPSGGVRILPSAGRPVFGVGPGVKMFSVTYLASWASASIGEMLSPTA